METFAVQLIKDIRKGKKNKRVQIVVTGLL